MQKKISKIFIVPNRLLGHTDHLYTYKGYVGHVGLTEKRKKLSKLAVLPVKKLMEQNWTKFFFYLRLILAHRVNALCVLNKL